MGRPPYLDEHAIAIEASPAQVWQALDRFAAALLGRAARSPLTWLLGAEPRAGFEVTERRAGEMLALAGRHRFARYELVFGIARAAQGTRLTATSYAEFPGVRGRAYRAVVVGTGGHVLATRGMLRRIRRAANARRVDRGGEQARGSAPPRKPGSVG
jgi:hypothetical protein